MKTKKSATVSACTVALAISLMSAGVSAQSICDGPKGCTTDQFGREAMWIAQGILEKATNLSSYDATRLRSCMTFPALSIATTLRKLEPITQAKYKKWSANIKENLTEMPQWYSSCKNFMSVEQFSTVIGAYLMTQRPKTKFSSVLSDPDAYRENTFRVDGYGQYAMNTFYLKSSPDDLNPIIVDLESEDKAVRETLVQKCGKAASLCKVTVQGRTKSSSPFVSVTMTDPIEIHSIR